MYFMYELTGKKLVCHLRLNPNYIGIDLRVKDTNFCLCNKVKKSKYSDVSLVCITFYLK